MAGSLQKQPSMNGRDLVCDAYAERLEGGGMIRIRFLEDGFPEWHQPGKLKARKIKKKMRSICHRGRDRSKEPAGRERQKKIGGLLRTRICWSGKGRNARRNGTVRERRSRVNGSARVR
ncbi:hypothetical protein H6P81_014570 [Aristolochia fimbriata]|uniref:Uncharacterized protein n=1 Tax=Aristolochia fimbriata TaxID=158543 RepID=A0AAV7E535_ARIFI|nr:hypothetical protein H6P81_014570 [Aristolochia fimbriata]